MAFPKRFNLKDVEYMRKLKESGLSYRAIARNMKADARTVRRALNGHTQIDENTETRYIERASSHEATLRRAAEKRWREVRHTIPTPRTLNQLLLGDPPAGRSALDRRQKDDERERVGVSMPNRVSERV
jgi:IS30 family transposase